MSMSPKSPKGGEHQRRPHVTAPAQAKITVGSTTLELPVRDMSTAGAFLFASQAPADIGDVVQLELRAFEGKSSASLWAEVARTVPREGSEELLGFGLHFVRVTPEQEQAVDAVLRELLGGSGGQRRAYPRIVHQLDVSCSASRSVKAALRDLSEGGAGLWVDTALAPGEPVALGLPRPGAPPLDVTGTVRSCSENPGVYRYVVGIELSLDAPEAKEGLRAYLNDVLRGAQATRRP